jgi:hypothetical protein
VGRDANGEGGAVYYATSCWVVDLPNGTVMEGVDAAEAAVGIALPYEGARQCDCGCGKVWARQIQRREFATLSRAVELEVDVVQNQDTVIIGWLKKLKRG